MGRDIAERVFPRNEAVPSHKIPILVRDLARIERQIGFEIEADRQSVLTGGWDSPVELRRELKNLQQACGGLLERPLNEALTSQALTTAQKKEILCNFPKDTGAVAIPPGLLPSYTDLTSVEVGPKKGHLALGNHDIETASKSFAFVEVSRPDPRNPDPIKASDKMHLSIHPEDMERAFQVLAPILFDDSNPCPHWKMSNLRELDPTTEGNRDHLRRLESDEERAKATEKLKRVHDGAQFTFYVAYTDDDVRDRWDAPPSPQSDKLTRFRDFVERVEDALTTAGIRTGAKPGSDVSGGHSYFSYRDEENSRDELTPELRRELEARPFFVGVMAPRH